eukprot:7199424-Prymnesium_polylepis.1
MIIFGSSNPIVAARTVSRFFVSCSSGRRARVGQCVAAAGDGHVRVSAWQWLEAGQCVAAARAVRAG